MRKAILAVALAGTALGTGCKSLGQAAFAPPIVSFHDLKLTGIGLTGGSVDIVLSVYNPNGFHLDATRLTYKLMVDSVELGDGATDSRFVVQGNDSSLVHLPLTFSYAGLGAAANQLKGTGTVNYRVLGDITVGTSVGTFTRDYDRVGRFAPLTKLPR
jgi:LEA14-like dessication related protein